MSVRKRTAKLLRTFGTGKITVDGSFAPNGSSALDKTKFDGEGWTAAYVSTGLYRVTVDTALQKLQSYGCSLLLATGDDKFAQPAAVTQATATSGAVFDIRVWDSSAAAVADVAAATGNRISFWLNFRTNDQDQ
jgi:hypothetical protein